MTPPCGVRGAALVAAHNDAQFEATIVRPPAPAPPRGSKASKLASKLPKRPQGLGIKLRPERGWVLVSGTTPVLRCSPRLAVGDAIVAVSGSSIVGLAMPQVAAMLRKAGDKVSITVLRDSVLTRANLTQLVEVTVPRPDGGGLGLGLVETEAAPGSGGGGSLIVTELSLYGAAAATGCVQPRDVVLQVDRRTLASHEQGNPLTMAELVQAIQAAGDTDDIVLLLHRPPPLAVASEAAQSASTPPQDGAAASEAGQDDDVANAAAPPAPGAVMDVEEFEKLAVDGWELHIFKAARRSATHSLGMQLAGMSDGRVSIVDVSQGGPARFAGVKPWDALVGVGTSREELWHVGGSVATAIARIQVQCKNGCAVR